MKNHLRKIRLTRGLSMQSLAERVGTNKSQIDKLEKGERRMTLDWMHRLSDALECQITDIFMAAPISHSPANLSSETVFTPKKDLPLIGGVRGGIHGFFFDNGKIAEYVNRPANLLGVQNAFAVYAIGDSMEPRFFAGEILYVNPNRPLSRGCFVAIELSDGQGLVKQYLKQDDRSITLYQYNPSKEIQLHRSKINNVYRIVGSAEQL